MSAGSSTGGSAGFVPDPNQPPGATATLTWKNLEPTELFSAAGPSFFDVLQNQSSDCAFDSALTAVALQNPNQIRNLIRFVGTTKSGNKVYGVTLYAGDFSNVPQEIVVDETLLVGGTSIYDPAVIDPNNGSRILWASMFRKANAVLRGGYEMATSPGSALAELSGRLPGSINPRSPSAQADLKSDLAAKDAVAVSSLSDGFGIPGSTDNGIYYCVPQNGMTYCVAKMHAYAIISDDGSTVTVRNPWGNNAISPIGDGRGQNGLVALPVGVFQKMFGLAVLESFP